MVTIIIAEAFGYRDRCQGIDSEERSITLSRFKGRARLEAAYWAGWHAADHYVNWHWDRGADAAEARLLREAETVHARDLPAMARIMERARVGRPQRASELLDFAVHLALVEVDPTMTVKPSARAPRPWPGNQDGTPVAAPC
jgi:hypothetical protein